MKLYDDIILTSNHNHRHILTDIRYIPDNKPKPVVVLIHGFKGFKDWGPFNDIANEFASAGFVFCKFNLSHNGTTIDEPNEITDKEAFGNNNFSIEMDDLDVVIKYLLSNKCPVPIDEMNREKLYLIGHSRGGGVAILKTAENQKVKALVTWAAISDLTNRWADEVISQWKQTGVYYVLNTRTNENLPLYYQLVTNFQQNKERLDIPKAASLVNVPWLICHGIEDETLPYSMAVDLKSWNNKAELFIMDGANHSFGGTFINRNIPTGLQVLVDKTLKFLKSF